MSEKQKNKKRIYILKVRILAILIILILLFVSCNIVYKCISIFALSKYGSSGSEVTNIQSKLKRWGYYNGIMVLKIFREENFKCNSVVEIQVICIINI